NISKSGYIFKSTPLDGKILHVRLGSISYHSIREYVSYNTLMRELDEYWKILQEYSQTLTVSSVSVRYINLVKLDSDETLDDMVTIRTKHPFVRLESELNQIKLDLDSETRTEGIIVVTNSISETRQGVVIDISVNRKFEGNPFKSIEDAFQGMQSWKNELFDKSI